MSTLKCGMCHGAGTVMGASKDGYNPRTCGECGGKGAFNKEPPQELDELFGQDPIEVILDEIRKLNRRKRSDYAEDSDIFSNFRRSADQIKMGPMASVEILIATKQARLRELIWSSKVPENESLEDTLLDRAVYSIIALAIYRETQQ
jgi:hypothetical protein